MGRYYTLVSEAYGAKALDKGVLDQVEFGDVGLDEDGYPDLSGEGYLAISWGAANPPDKARPLQMTCIHDGAWDFEWDKGIDEIIRQFPDLEGPMTEKELRFMQPAAFCAMLEARGFKSDVDFEPEK